MPGAGLMARKMVSRLWGVATASKVVLVTSVQAAMPPPVSLGLGAAGLEVWPRTATVMSVLGAGAIGAVV